MSAGFPKAIIAITLVAMLAMVGVAFALLLRRRLLGDAEKRGSDELSLSALRSLRDRGQLTDEEFARARDVVLRAHGVDRPGASQDPPRAGGPGGAAAEHRADAAQGEPPTPHA